MEPETLDHPDRLLDADPAVRGIARELLEAIETLPLVSPHGHVPIEWFDRDFRFTDATDLLIQPDHYLLRMFVSLGFRYEDLGVAGAGSREVADQRTAFRNFASNYHLFLGTPSRSWLDHSLSQVLGIREPLTGDTADNIYDRINGKLQLAEFTPRALFRRFGIEVLATTDSAVDDLGRHRDLAADPDFDGRVIPTFRPDSVTDPDHRDFASDMARLAEITGRDIARWPDYLNALRDRRAAFRDCGATATDHGFQSARTASHDMGECQALLDAALAGRATPEQAAAFRGQMLYEMARMSCDDGLVMQIHAGSWRNYAPSVYATYGPDKGFDIPTRVDWATGLKPLLDDFGFNPNLRMILYTLDESGYGRELAPLAGAFPVLRLGAPWWFFDSPGGMARHFDEVVETAGFYNLAGFVDDTRAFLSIPARHDVYRRAVASHLARLVSRHQLTADQALSLARALAADLARESYRLDSV